MGHNARMSADPSAESPAPSWVDRVRILVERVRVSGQRLYERVPPHVRAIAQRVFSAAILTLIGIALYRQLRGTDWPQVLRSLPTSPWFYLLFGLRFLNLPVVETLCYSAVWATNLFRHFGAFLMKYILNTAVAGTTGDLYFLLWSVRTLRIGYRQAFSAVKDVTLLSAAAANGVAVAVLGGYFALGDLSLTETVSRGAVTAVVAVTLVAAALSLLLIVFRSRVLNVSASVMMRILGYHTIRSAGDLILLGLQWTAGLPGTAFSDWISLLIVALLVSRTPGVPAKDLLFLSLALALGDSVDADQIQVKALFLADAALRQVVVVASFIAGALWRSRPHPIPLDSTGSTPPHAS